MNNYGFKNYLYIFVSNLILIMNLCIINIGLKTLTYSSRLYISIFSIFIYILWVYFSFKNKEDKKNQIFKINILMGFFIIILFIVCKLTMFGELVKQNGIENILESYGGYGKLIYFLICFLQPIILPLPEPVTITAGNLVFGKILGFLLGFIGTILGITTMFLASRFLNSKLNLNIINSKNIKKYNELVQKNETFILILLFIFPILSDEIICIGAGLSLIRFKKFLHISIFSKFITIGLYSVSSNIVVKIFELNIFHQILIVSTIVLIVLTLKKIIEYIRK